MSRATDPLLPLPIYPGTKPRFHAMVKPTGAIRNLDCAYCYYLHKEELLGSDSKFRISDEILEAHVRQYIESQRGDEVVFSWQGGEPTLLGAGFFEKVVALEKKYQRPNQRIENDLQTNGTLLNDEWCAFLRENKFLVGLSIDGPQELHDRFRVDKGGQPTFAKGFAAVRSRNDEWCAFLRENKFLVGRSIDGPQELHDRFRGDKGGQPTFAKVFAAGRLLQKY